MTSLSNSILVVEDDLDDQYLIKLALNQVDEALDIVFISHGDDALEWFTTNEKEAINSLRFVVLDLNLPGVSGMDVLRSFRMRSTANELPIAVLSTSQFELEHKEAHSLGANHVFVKPNSIGLLRDIFQQLILRYGHREP